jgi:hypothetical protein
MKEKKFIISMTKVKGKLIFTPGNKIRKGKSKKAGAGKMSNRPFASC